MENKKGIEKILDSFLIELLTNPIDTKTPCQTGFVGMAHHITKLKLIPNELYELIQYLEDDKYIHIISERPVSNTEAVKLSEVSVNLRGKEFIKYGGYIQEKKDSNRSKKVERNHRWILSIGTIVAGLYAIGWLILNGSEIYYKILESLGLWKAVN